MPLRLFADRPGTPAFFVHPGEASHGDMGMITARDVVLTLSNSGETAEILILLPLIKRLAEASSPPAGPGQRVHPAPAHRDRAAGGNLPSRQRCPRGAVRAPAGPGGRRQYGFRREHGDTARPPGARDADRVRRPGRTGGGPGLLDIGLPGMDGYEVARRLRTDLHMAETVLIAMTGYGHEQDRREAQAAGFNHHLVKPVDPAALQRVLASLRGKLTTDPANHTGEDIFFTSRVSDACGSSKVFTRQPCVGTRKDGSDLRGLPQGDRVSRKTSGCLMTILSSTTLQAPR